MQHSREDLMRAWRDMQRIRQFEDRVMREMETGDVPGNTHLSAGQEASAVGVCFRLGAGDRIASTHRGHGHSIAKGCDVAGMMAEIFGRATGTCHGKGGSMHIADLDRGMLGANGIVGGSLPIACGAALTAAQLGTGTVAVAFAGDGAFNQGTMSETLNLAAVWRLPLIVAVEDNGFAEATSSRATTAGAITERAAAYGVAVESVDGMDFFAVEAAAATAVARARAGGGPSLLHMTTERYYGHFSGDADTYRSAEAHARMRARDCLARFRRMVTEAALLEAADLDAVEREVAEEIEAAVTAARAAPRPAAADLVTDVYVAYP